MLEGASRAPPRPTRSPAAPDPRTVLPVRTTTTSKYVALVRRGSTQPRVGHCYPSGRQLPVHTEPLCDAVAEQLPNPALLLVRTTTTPNYVALVRRGSTQLRVRHGDPTGRSRRRPRRVPTANVCTGQGAKRIHVRLLDRRPPGMSTSACPQAPLLSAFQVHSVRSEQIARRRGRGHAAAGFQKEQR